MSARRTVLVVDGHEDSRLIYSAVLEHHGFAVLAAACADEALRLARQRRPDLICLEMPRAPGDEWAAWRTLRAHDGMDGVPVVAISTGFREDAERRAAAAGCAAYLLKPCAPLLLLAEVRRVLDG